VQRIATLEWTLAAILCACSSPAPAGPDEPACVSNMATDCSPLYTPTYDEVFTRTLKPTCGRSGASCHGPGGAQGGLKIDEADSTYESLVHGSAARVRPGDPACSPVIKRLFATDESVMPPGRALSPEEKCSIVQWIAQGATR
jgi:hypothetical protein